jgi:hypothetical protein
LLIAASLALACHCTVFAQSEKAATREPIVKVRGFKGTPSILRTNRWFALQVGEQIPAGATVRTGGGDTLECVLDEPGRVVAFGAESLAVIDLRTSLINLEAGELVGAIRNSRKGNSSLTIRSRFGVSTVRAADFRLALKPEQSISVLDGLVEFVPARASREGSIQLRDDSHLIGQAEDPLLQKMDAPTRSFLVGRIDAVSSYRAPLAKNFSPREIVGLCHVPPVPGLVDPENRPGREAGFQAAPELVASEYATAANVKSSAECPVHNVAVLAPGPGKNGKSVVVPHNDDLPAAFQRKEEIISEP